MLPNLKLYAAAGAILAVIVLGWWLHHSGFEAGQKAAHSDMQADVDAANARTDTINRERVRLAEELGHEIEALRTERDTALGHARSIIRPVRLCPPAGNRAVSGAANATPTTAPADAGTDLSVRPSATDQPAGDMPDISAGLLEIVSACQRDNDKARGWDAYWSGLRAEIR